LFPTVALEVAPLETTDYIPVVHAGAEGLVVYQELIIQLPMPNSTQRAQKKILVGGSIALNAHMPRVFVVSALARYLVWLPGKKKRWPWRRTLNIFSNIAGKLP